MDGKARWVDNVISGEVVPQPQDRVREDRRARDACGARGLVAAYVEQYNNARPHQSLGYDMPAEWCHSGLMAARAATLKDLGSLSDQDFASKRTGHITLYRGSGSDWAGKSA